MNWVKAIAAELWEWVCVGIVVCLFLLGFMYAGYLLILLCIGLFIAGAVKKANLYSRNAKTGISD